jgi:hypothetical protein
MSGTLILAAAVLVAPVTAVTPAAPRRPVILLLLVLRMRGV